MVNPINYPISEEGEGAGGSRLGTGELVFIDFMRISIGAYSNI